MHCPKLIELPPPPPNKTGWPWTEETSALPNIIADAPKWPRVKIVTPSYNQGKYLEETIRSVLLQGYPNLDYVVIDGGSNDNSVEILKKYDPWLTYWVSESDHGQPHALNKGFSKQTDGIAAFLNSDDVYLPNTIIYIVEHFLSNPEHDFICGQTKFIDENSISRAGFEDLFKCEINDKTITETCHIAQPSTFFRSKVFKEVGFFDEHLHYSFDYDFWLRAYLFGFSFASTSQILSLFRLHNTSKTNTAYKEGRFDRDFITTYSKALSSKNLTRVQRRGIRRGLGFALSLLFVHSEASSNTKTARNELLLFVMKVPEVLLERSIWPTFLVSILPDFARSFWRSLKIACSNFNKNIC